VTEASALATALAFVRHGYAVFPVNWPIKHNNGQLRCSCGSDSRGRPCTSPAKHPYGKLAPNGLLSATTEIGVVKHWWGYLAPDANLGLCTDRLVVIDIDPRHGGDESLAALEREHGEMPPTWRVLTGGGGEHVLFVCPDGVEISNVVAAQMESPPLGPGIDVRARGGYIVAPPSRHISGRSYAWSVDHHPQDVPLAPAPDWLVARLTTRRTMASADGTLAEPIASDVWAQLMRQPISEYRDMAAARIVGHLFRHSCDYELVLGLLHAWNSAWCKPPLGYHELERIVGRIADREAARIEQQLRDWR
jgi:Bifunctional DNA primase/polymerase, N-terminal/Primase C terminal 1 (PriCT-1)